MGISVFVEMIILGRGAHTRNAMGLYTLINYTHAYSMISKNEKKVRIAVFYFEMQTDS